MKTYDISRSQFLLRDLERSTRGAMPMFQFDDSEPAGPLLTAIANRAGLLRLGVRLAAAAFTANNRVVLDSYGKVAGNGQPGIIEISLLEDLSGTPARRTPFARRLDVKHLRREAIAVGVLLVVGMLAAVGMVSMITELFLR